MIKDNLKAVERQIQEACDKAGRKRGDVRLLAVSKTHPVETILEAYNANVRCFGENRVMELKEKTAALPKDIEWHLIGHLQHNKVKAAVQNAHWIHSVDSMELLERINAEAAKMGRTPLLLLEVNVSGEQSKFGLAPEQVLKVAEAAVVAERNGGCPLRGLMTMAPLGADEAMLHQVFGGLRELRDTLEERLEVVLPELSMGMSGDFPVAIAEGATIVRVGTAIFGAREYPVTEEGGGNP